MVNLQRKGEEQNYCTLRRNPYFRRVEMPRSSEEGMNEAGNAGSGGLSTHTTVDGRMVLVLEEGQHSENVRLTNFIHSFPSL